MFQISIYSPFGQYITTKKFATEPTQKQRIALRERESKKYGAGVRLTKPTDEEVARHEQRSQWN